MSNIKLAINGNKEAFIKVIEEYKVPIYKTAKAILKDEDDACDAMQDALISMYENIATLKNEKYFKTWATRIVINQCYHFIKKQKINQEKIVKIQTQYFDEDSFTKYDEKTDVETAILKLDKDLR